MLSSSFWGYGVTCSTKCIYYSYNTKYSTTKLQTQLITTGIWGKENQSPHTAKPSTVKSYGHCSSIKKLKVVVTNVYEPVRLMYHFWLWCVQRWYEGSEAQMVTKNQKFLQQVGQSHTLPPIQHLDVSGPWLTHLLQQLPQHKKKKKKCEKAG